MKFSIFNFQFSKKYIWVLLAGIIVLAAVLRFWKLGITPNGIDWDEASLGYNAYSILHTAKDEYGTFLPIVLKSFGDYKPALYAYLSVPSIALFGLTAFAIRFPSALLGTLSVLLIFFLVKELFKKNSLALLSSLLLAISPWHIQFSRVAFETNTGLFFNIAGAFLFLKGLKRPWIFIFSAVSFALNLYVYQSEKIFTPLLVMLLFILFWRQVWGISKKYLAIIIIIGAVIIFPIVLYTFFNTNGLARAQGVSIFSSNTKISQIITRRYLYNKNTNNKIGLFLDNGRLLYVKQALGNYLSHFDLNWLFITGDINRHHAPDMGLLYLWELPFLFIGIYSLIFGPYSRRIKLFTFGWLLLSPLPAAITNDVPHAVRTLNSVAIYQIIIASGLIFSIENLRRKWVRGVFIGGLVFIVIFNFTYYLDQYFVQQNYFYTSDWQYGYSQIVSMTDVLGKSYSHIVVDSTDQFSQSYIFYLFYLKEDPITYQKANNFDSSKSHSFGKYIFRSIDWSKDSTLKNTLFVGSPSHFPGGIFGILKIINSANGQPLAEFVGR